MWYDILIESLNNYVILITHTGELIYYEKPLISAPENKQTQCSYCLHPNLNSSELVACNKCNLEYYCSIYCMQTAWNNYHSFFMHENARK